MAMKPVFVATSSARRQKKDRRERGERGEGNTCSPSTVCNVILHICTM